MRINRNGVTRTVFMFKNFVVKVPNLRYGYRNLLRGILCNIDEGNTWKLNEFRKVERDTFLCPVIWYTKTGFMLIMRRADVTKHEQEMSLLEGLDREQVMSYRKNYYMAWENLGFGGDDKPDNYGYLDGRLVKVDYAL